jgi:16S rRNA (cytosine1402-N4)-methyltransferase
MSRHVPVLLSEVIDLLELTTGLKVVDATLGDGGHSEKILEKIGPEGRLLGIDADTESLLRSKRNLYRFENQIQFVHGNFVDLTNILLEYGFVPVDRILIDFGWSSPQFSERGRGFSFDTNEPLDMRYGGSSNRWSETAADILRTSSESELRQVFKKYGEEELSSEIAAAIVEERMVAPIETTQQLVAIVLQVYRTKLKSTKEIPCHEVDSKQKLGVAIGLPVSASAIAVIDAGDAASDIAQLKAGKVKHGKAAANE